MSKDELSMRLTSLLRRAGLAHVPRAALVGVLALAIVFMGLGVWRFWPRQGDAFSIGSASSSSMEASQADDAERAQTPSTVIVDVEGAVASPGLYELESGMRVGDAVEAAGGLTADAASGAINLAKVVSDGEQVRIPTQQEIASAGQSAQSALQQSSSSESRSSSDSNGKVNINTATSTELQTLSGIGPSLAERIVEYREANGAFSSIDGLKKVSGIGDVRFASLKDKICV